MKEKFGTEVKIIKLIIKFGSVYKNIQSQGSYASDNFFQIIANISFVNSSAWIFFNKIKIVFYSVDYQIMSFFTNKIVGFVVNINLR